VPLTVAAIFMVWLVRHRPEAAASDAPLAARGDQK
jgi:hypothetical protein